MAKLQPVRGTRDLLPEDCARHRRVSETARMLCERAGYLEIETPIFEFTEVFSRTLGETSDVVTKEMYTFEDRGGERLTLRPENTAGVVRAVIAGGLTQALPLKYFYSGPMFRYERPQKGRLREFHQIGIELMGVAEPLGDVEVIALGAETLVALGVSNKTTLELNSLGDAESRRAYREALVAYLERHRDALSEDSRQRLERNPLRILDSKDEGDRAIIAEAPRVGDHLNAASREFFAAVCRGLEALELAYVLNPRLVRGLDYYCHTAFEFTTSELGAQGAVVAGGRYDGLIESMGGPPIPGVGWAAGIERLAMLLPQAGPTLRPLALIPLGEEAERGALALARDLRHEGFAVDFAYRGQLKKALRHANRINARAALILGETECAARAIVVRDLDRGEQETVPLSDLRRRLRALS
ncbi:MAG TPA: histidine--tRNA ligase [Alphaproteobacteria bacterium]|nr:histidine--tRNA ligase [Alphaproteobacteria bacterium]